MVEDLQGLNIEFVDPALQDVLRQSTPIICSSVLLLILACAEVLRFLVVKIDSDYYPAILRKFFLINTPAFFKYASLVSKTDLAVGCYGI